MPIKVFGNLQIARSAAAIFVLMFHANGLIGKHVFYGVFLPGWCGVDLFFVISGFIIHHSNKSLIGNPLQLKSYLLRRLIRIYPVHWICLFLVLLLCYVLVSVNLFSYSFNWDLIVKSFFLWPTKIGELPTNPVTWTLCHEVFFYVLFGICSAVGKRFSIAILFIWLSVMLLPLKYYSENAFLQMTTNTKNIEFVFGCFISVFADKFRLSKKSIYLIFLLGLLLMISSWFYIWKMDLVHGKFDFIFLGIPFTLIVYALIKLENKNINKAKFLFIKFGDASYSIYLTHFMSLFFLIYFLSNFIVNKTVMFVFVNSVSFVLGLLFFLLIEKPLTSYLRKLISYKYTPNNSEKFQKISSHLDSLDVTL